MKHLNRKLVLPVVLSLTLLTGACSAAETAGSAASTTATSDAATSAATTTAATTSTAAQTLAENAVAVATSDAGYDESSVVDITLTGTGATTDSSAVTVSGSTVTITAAGTYRITGSLDDGQVVVNSAGDGTVRIILNGVDISSSTTSPLVVTDAAGRRDRTGGRHPEHADRRRPRTSTPMRPPTNRTPPCSAPPT